MRTLPLSSCRLSWSLGLISLLINGWRLRDYSGKHPQIKVPSTVFTGSGVRQGIPGTSGWLLMHSSTTMEILTPLRTLTLPPFRPWPGASTGRRLWWLSRTANNMMPTLIMCWHALLRTIIRRACLAWVRGMPPLCQQQLQDVCGILSQNRRSSNSHFHPIVCDDSSCPLLSPAVILAVNADGVNDASVAAGPVLPQVNQKRLKPDASARRYSATLLSDKNETRHGVWVWNSQV